LVGLLSVADLGDTEMLLPKPGSDIILNGHAYVPRGEHASVIDTRLSIGKVSKQ
jgi:hypothetical protein